MLDAEARLLAARQRSDAVVVPINVAATDYQATPSGLDTRTLRRSGALCTVDHHFRSGARRASRTGGHRQVDRDGRTARRLGTSTTATARSWDSPRPPRRPRSSRGHRYRDRQPVKWLHEHRQRGRRARELGVLRERARTDRRFRRRSSPHLRDSITQREYALERWSLRAGQLVVVDEASLAPTFALDELMSAASDAGAKVVLAGDWAQLSSIDAGGMFRTLVRDRGEEVATLSDVRRLRAKWEKRASLGIRLGKSRALSSYASHGRITQGSRDDLLDALYAAWKSDCHHGRRSLMLAGDAETVSELNRRVQADRVESGAVFDVTDLGAGLTIGVNDLVVTRQNDRRLVTERGWVKNGDEWRVAQVHANGSLSVVRSKGSGSVCLPSHYVREHVELAYASTAHRAQGRTFDTAHAFVSPTTTREVLYVALTRGADANNLYVDTHYDPDPDTGHEVLATTPSALEVLEAVLRREGADVSATDVIRQAQSQSVATLVAEYETIVGLADGERWKATLLKSGLSEVELVRTTSSPAYPTLISKLREAEQRGLDAAVELPLLVKGRTFEDADDVANVLHHRINRYLSAVGYPTLVDEQLVLGLIPRPKGHSDADVERALNDRIAAIEQRARELATLAIDRGDRWVRIFGP